MEKLKLALIFGGKSPEHEVSVNSARSVLAAINHDRFEVFCIGISKTGDWVLLSSASLQDAQTKEVVSDQSNRIFVWQDQNGKVAARKLSSGELVSSLDVAFPLIHGPNGEDGTIQGFFELINLPYVGCGVASSAVCIDKEITKRLLAHAGVPQAKYIVADRSADKCKSMLAQFSFPVFVKPVCQGSSVGISKVGELAQLQSALDLAFQYDAKVIIEEGISGREIECSILGNSNPQASLPGEIIVFGKNQFYSYEAKYGDMSGTKLNIPAELSADIVAKVQETALRAYKILGCRGLARVDTFLTPSGQVLVNEVNTMPGFTKLYSEYPKLWEVSGLPYAKLLDRLVDLALEKSEGS